MSESDSNTPLFSSFQIPPPSYYQSQASHGHGLEEPPNAYNSVGYIPENEYTREEEDTGDSDPCENDRVIPLTTLSCVLFIPLLNLTLIFLTSNNLIESPVEISLWIFLTTAFWLAIVAYLVYLFNFAKVRCAEDDLEAVIVRSREPVDFEMEAVQVVGGAGSP